MRLRGRPLLSMLGVLALLVAACGAPGTSAPGSKTPEGSGAGASSPAGGDSKAPAGSGAPEASGPKKPSCADGSCFECGEGVCPVGFYCQKSGGTAGCAWASECAQKPSCACVGPLSTGCSCEERGGVPHVTCGS